MIPKPLKDIPLIPLRAFAKQVPAVMSVTKKESDQHIAEIQAAHAKQRAAKKKAA